MIETIKGNNLIGQLINSDQGIDIDNLSYLAIDQSYILDTDFDERGPIKELTDVFDQYYDITLRQGEWVFDNPFLLTKLIKFRALMYQNVYMNPHNRAKEAFLVKTLKGQKLELEQAIAWKDDDFIYWFKTTYGQEEFFHFFQERHPFRIKGVVHDFDPDNLEKTITELKKQEDETTVVEYLKPPRCATGNSVLHNNKIVWLDQVPEHSKEIEKNQTNNKKSKLYRYI